MRSVVYEEIRFGVNEVTRLHTASPEHHYQQTLFGRLEEKHGQKHHEVDHHQCRQQLIALTIHTGALARGINYPGWKHAHEHAQEDVVT